MKHLILLLTFLSLFTSSPLKAQDYFSEQTTWVYDKPTFNINLSSYTTLTSFGDSIFNGDTLTYIDGLVNCSVGENSLLKQVDKKVYRLNTCDSTFSLLYDFGVEFGDTLRIPTDYCSYNDTLVLLVDSVFISTINGIDKNSFRLSNISSGLSTFSGIVIEGIGNIHNFYPMLETCDPNGSTLRCFTNSTLGEYNSGLNGGDCYYKNLNLNEVNSENTALFPNPNNGTFKLVFKTKQKDLTVEIINSVGLQIFEQNYLETQEVSITENLPTGIYYMLINTTIGKSESVKFVVR